MVNIDDDLRRGEERVMDALRVTAEVNAESSPDGVFRNGKCFNKSARRNRPSFKFDKCRPGR